MQASEIIALLETEIKLRGDLEVWFFGRYGASEDTFEIVEDKNVSKEERYRINVWTNIMTG